MPVTRGNLDSSCGVAGVASSPPSGLGLVVELVLTDGAADCGVLGFGVTVCAVSGWVTIALPNCAVFIFHQTPPAIAATITIPTRTIGMRNLRGPASAVTCPKSGGSVSVWAA